MRDGPDSVERAAGNAPAVPMLQVRPGYLISRLIKGGWQLAGDHGTVDRAQAINDMIEFANAGVVTFDCADIYTGVEEMIGAFRAELTRQRGEAASQKIKIHTKYVPDRDNLANLSFRDIEAGIDRSLRRLGQEHLDLVQFHWWNYAVEGCEEAVGHLAKLRDKGKIDQIGVTNFDLEHLERLAAVTDIASSQVQYSLLDKRVEGDFAAFAKVNNISIFAYGVLAGGFLTDAWLDEPDPGYQFENRSLVKYRLIIDEVGGWDLFQDLLTALRAVADRHNTDIATIALRAMLDRSDVATAIVGARYASRLPNLLAVFGITMTSRDQADINTVCSRANGPNGPVFGLERDISGPHGRIMKYNLNKGDNRQATTAVQKSETV
ncbi:MAG: aldo/keto reductase [Rhizobiaceae bacterium]